jgi:Ca2+-transporting ATPase
MLYYNLSPEKALKELKTGEEGLSDGEAARRRAIYGLNDITSEKRISALKVMLGQFSSPLVWILVAAVIIAFALNELTEAAVILIILILNAFFGFIQEFKAEKAIEALKKMTALKAKAIRNSQLIEIDTKELVPGDIICLEIGDRVPADARIISLSNLEVQEAALTGESTPVEKTIDTIEGNAGLGDMKNMVFSSTIITMGRCRAVVTHTGKESEIGRIAKMIENAEEAKTPLQIKLHHLAKWLGITVIAIAIIVFAAGIIRDGINYTNALNMLIVSIALAVAAIPEGLPAIVTISLAISVKKMVKKNALVRKLASVETLGACSVICTDKTGTLTHNEMTVRKIFANNEIINVFGSGYGTQGNFSANPEKIRLLLTAGMLCNESEIVNEEGANKVIGDPTEGALIVSAMKAGLNHNRLKEAYSRIDEIPFSSERKMMTTIHRSASKTVAFSKGAPDVLLEKCSKNLINGKEINLTKTQKEEILKKTEEFASSALRVLGFAYNFEKTGKKECEKDMVFLGLQGMIDPPRSEARDAIAKCRRAGIKVVMITGDHKNTAVAVAKELGITGCVLTGKELEKVKNLEKAVETIGIYARVDPKHKLKIVEAFQKKGHIIAMTGDGVNDAPALKEADIGIAMGITGTDVAKEASDMILSDDNFTSIVSAVEEGRTIFDNIKKFVRYLLSSNVGEVLTIFGAMMAGLKLPVTAIQILWINLVTDGLPALAVGVEKPEQHIMERSPRNEKEEIITKKESVFIVSLGILMMIATVGMFLLGLIQKGWVWGTAPDAGTYTYATTLAFCTLMMLQMFNVINNVSEKNSIFKTNILNNKYLILAVFASVLMQIAVVNIPSLAELFEVTALPLKDWAYIMLVSSSVLIAGEIFKRARK